MREDVRVARLTMRWTLAWTVAMPFVIGFLTVASPIGPSPMFEPWYVEALPWMCSGFYLAGLIWMVRIYRSSHLEPEATGWRYRS